jgi:hypothetical protein
MAPVEIETERLDRVGLEAVCLDPTWGGRFLRLEQVCCTIDRDEWPPRDTDMPTMKIRQVNEQ